MNKSFCSLAFNHISTRPDGVARLCCNTRDSINDADGTPFNLGTHRVEDILNSEHYRRIRRDMLAGNTVPECSSCIFQEQYGESSPRKIYNESWPARDPKEYVNHNEIEYLDIRFGNLCNLKCMSCSPHSSSQIDKDIKDIADTRPDILQFHTPIDFDINSWYKTDIFEDNMKKIKDKLSLIYMTGGEPTLVEENFKFMSLLIANGLSKNITLKFSINLTNIKNEFVSALKQFKEVILLCSIDGTGNVQEYLRYPSNWDQVDSNFRKLLELENAKVIVTPVVQNINLEFLSELFQYVENFNVGHNKIMIYPQILHGPEHLNINTLPLSYKKYCLDKLNDWIKKPNTQPKLFYEKIKQIENLCNDNHQRRDNLLSFKKYIEIYDAHRSTSLNDVNPKLYDIINSSW